MRLIAGKYGMAQCAFLASLVKKCRSPVFAIFMPKNLSTDGLACIGFTTCQDDF